MSSLTNHSGDVFARSCETADWVRMTTDKRILITDKCGLYCISERAEPVIVAIVEKIRLMCLGCNEPHVQTVFDVQGFDVGLTIESYITRTAKLAVVNKPELYTALLFMYRAYELRKFNFVERNVYKIWLTCLLLAKKTLDDKCPRNTFYAEVGGVSPDAINKMELTLLYLLEFDVGITDDQYKAFEYAMDLCVLPLTNTAHIEITA